MELGEKQKMAAEPKRIKVDKDTHIQPILEAAKDRAVIIEMNGFAYRVNPVGDTASPFTARTAYASVKTVDGRLGREVSNEEIEEAIHLANEDIVRKWT